MIRRYRRPDSRSAASLLEAAEKEMGYTLTLHPTDESASTIIRNIYECFRMLGDALLLVRGLEAIDHVHAIRELLTMRVQTSRPIQLIDHLRQLRHNINYYGYLPKQREAQDAISLAKACFGPLRDAVSAAIKNS